MNSWEWIALCVFELCIVTFFCLSYAFGRQKSENSTERAGNTMRDPNEKKLSPMRHRLQRIIQDLSDCEKGFRHLAGSLAAVEADGTSALRQGSDEQKNANGRTGDAGRTLCTRIVKLEAAVNDIASKAKAGADTIRYMERKASGLAGEMQFVVDECRELADQTSAQQAAMRWMLDTNGMMNVVALDASLALERLGEADPGIAVMARESRRLAGLNQQATIQAAQRYEKLTYDADRSTQNAREVAQKVDSVLPDISRRTAGLVTAVTGGVQQLESSVAEVSRMAREVSEMAEGLQKRLDMSERRNAEVLKVLHNIRNESETRIRQLMQKLGNTSRTVEDLVRQVSPASPENETSAAERKETLVVIPLLPVDAT